jgi:hypothetical protein
MYASVFSQRALLPTPNTSKNPDPTKFTEYLSWTAVPNFVELHGLTNNLIPETTQFLSVPTDLDTQSTQLKPVQAHMPSQISSFI